MNSLDTSELLHQWMLKSLCTCTWYVLCLIDICCRNKLRSLYYSTHVRKLLSSADDGMVGLWDLEAERQEVSGHRLNTQPWELVCMCIARLNII